MPRECRHMSENFDPARSATLPPSDDVRDRHPAAMTRATGKVLRRLDRHCRAILERSTFWSSARRVRRGRRLAARDPAGFVRVLDDRHVLLPTASATTASTATPTCSRTRRSACCSWYPAWPRSCASTAGARHRRCGLLAPRPCKVAHRGSGADRGARKPTCTAPRR